MINRFFEGMGLENHYSFRPFEQPGNFERNKRFVICDKNENDVEKI